MNPTCPWVREIIDLSSGLVLIVPTISSMYFIVCSEKSVFLQRIANSGRKRIPGKHGQLGALGTGGLIERAGCVALMGDVKHFTTFIQTFK